tara:strand:+ start:20727 stop:20951 length:225 start_codon:yes stop_codon:yes gene_type:complete
LNKAKKIVSEVFNLNIDDISDTSSIGQLPGWDSLGHMRLILKIEKIISRSIRTEEILSIVNIESIEKILEKNKK